MPVKPNAVLSNALEKGETLCVRECFLGLGLVGQVDQVLLFLISGNVRCDGLLDEGNEFFEVSHWACFERWHYS